MRTTLVVVLIACVGAARINTNKRVETVGTKENVALENRKADAANKELELSKFEQSLERKGGETASEEPKGRSSVHDEQTPPPRIKPAETVRITTTKTTTTQLDRVMPCAEEKVEDLCECRKKSNRNYLCNKCKDSSKWGRGCKLDCPAACPDSCDFVGECPWVGCPDNCIRSQRQNVTRTTDCLNIAGECMACQDGWYGTMCESQCPQDCGPSPEGKCMRDGTCYRCASGFFGPRCEQHCPAACPRCHMEDKEIEGELVPAGTCDQVCEGDFYGPKCGKKCPVHCEKTKNPMRPSCLNNDEGTCKACEPGWYGTRCEMECSPGCSDRLCHRETGVCTNDCVPGKWGPNCDKDCPEYTIMEKGCDRGDGEPVECDATHFPKRDPVTRVPFCAACPENCANGECNGKGECTGECKVGFWGPDCSNECPDGCEEEGGCDKKDGTCKACKPGKTARKCDKPCHGQCDTCKQYHDERRKTPGDTPKDCLTCRENEASVMDESERVCKCIEGASRLNEQAKCKCDQDPQMDPNMRIVFQEDFNFEKKCLALCKNELNLRMVTSKKMNRHKCIPQAIYKAVLIKYDQKLPDKCQSDDGAGQGDKDEKYDKYNVVADSGDQMCLEKEFIDYIVHR